MAEATQQPRGAAIPGTAEEAIRVAATLGLIIPAECLPGVIANLAVLDRHAGIFLGKAA